MSGTVSLLVPSAAKAGMRPRGQSAVSREGRALRQLVRTEPPAAQAQRAASMQGEAECHNYESYRPKPSCRIPTSSWSSRLNPDES